MKKLSFRYFDYNSTTPLLKEISTYIDKFQKRFFGNPVSLHYAGQLCAAEVLKARENIAQFFNASAENVIFTSSGAEANNLVLWGTFLYNKINNTGKLHFISSTVEHPSVLEPLKIIKKLQGEYDLIECDRYCNIAIENVKQKIKPQTALISIMHSNNEIGTLQPIEKLKDLKDDIVIHSDIIQSVGKLVIDFSKLPVDVISVSAHKFFGPKGIGALIFYRKPSLIPIICGGIQENSLRAGTHNIAGIIGFSKAIDYLRANIEKIEKELKKRFEYLYEKLSKIQGVVINTPYTNNIHNTLNLSIPAYTKDELLVKLDNDGFCISTGTACLSGTSRISHVIEAMKLPEELAKSAIRISFSHFTPFSHLKALVEEIKFLTSKT